MFPLWYLLLPYALFTLITAFFWIFNLSDIAKFGMQVKTTLLVLGMYFFGFFAVLAVTVLLLAQFDWTTTVNTATLFILPTNSLFNL